MSDIGNRIKILREKQGYTQADLGTLVNVSPRVIGNWEKNINSPSIDNLVDLCVALSTTPAFLLDYPDDDDLTFTEKNLVENYRKIDSRGQQNINIMLQHELSVQKDLLNVTAPTPPAQSDIYNGLNLFLSRKDAQYKDMQQECVKIAELQKSSGSSDLEVARFLWSLGISQFSAGTMLLIRTRLRVPTPELAHIIICYLTGNYKICLPPYSPSNT